jgi:hypothetical protein
MEGSDGKEPSRCARRELLDEPLLEEIELLTQVMAALTAYRGHLTADQIDEVLHASQSQQEH